MQFKPRYEGPWSELGRRPPQKTGDWRFQRPVTKIGKCRQCGVCYIFCPGGCINDKGTYFSADLDYCKGCGICARVCPIDAIVMIREGR